jgi:hypothetical protein
MKRISMLLLCLCAAAWTSGCCCSHYSRYADCDDGYDCNQHLKRSRHRRSRSDRVGRSGTMDACCDDGCCGDCCDSCCGDSAAQPGQSGPPMTYEGGAAMGGGCASGNCGSTAMSSGVPSGVPMYSGTNGMPFPPGEGWTIQSTTSHPIGNEPHPAPGSNSTPITITPAPSNTQGWTNPSSVPVPAPVPPPVSYNR